MLFELVLVGNFATDVEILKAKSGEDYIRFNFARPRKGRDKVDFFTFCVYGKNIAQFKHCRKGDRAVIGGRVERNGYKKGEIWISTDDYIAEWVGTEEEYTEKLREYLKWIKKQ